MWPFSTANERQAEAMSMILAENAYERRLASDKQHQTNYCGCCNCWYNLSNFGWHGYLASSKPRSHLAIHSGRVS